MSRSETSATPDRRRRQLALAALLLVLAAAALPAVAARHPPLHAYYQWVLQGHVLKQLAAPEPEVAEPASSYYALRARPVPNMGATVAVAALDLVLSPSDAGRVFLALAAISFGLGFAVLARTVQGRPTAVELLAFPWAYGFLAYSGYLSCLLSLGLAMLSIAVLHRFATAAAGAPEASATRRMCLALALLGAFVWMTHIAGWAVLAWTVAVYAVWLARRGDRRRARQLALALVPSLALLAWHAAVVVSRTVTLGRESRTELYAEWLDKLTSLSRGLLLFLRIDPFEWGVSVFWLNVLAACAIAAEPRPASWPARTISLTKFR